MAVVSEHGPNVELVNLERSCGYVGADEPMGRMLRLSPPSKVVVLAKHDEPRMVKRFLSRGPAFFSESAEVGDSSPRSTRRGAPSLGNGWQPEVEGGSNSDPLFSADTFDLLAEPATPWCDEEYGIGDLCG